MQDMIMATLSLTDDQVLQLIKQLPAHSKQRILADLTAERDQWWKTTAQNGEKDMRRVAAARGLDWILSRKHNVRLSLTICYTSRERAALRRI